MKVSHILIHFRLVLFENQAVFTWKLRLGISDHFFVLTFSALISKKLPSSGLPKGNGIFFVFRFF